MESTKLDTKHIKYGAIQAVDLVKKKRRKGTQKTKGACFVKTRQEKEISVKRNQEEKAEFLRGVKEKKTYQTKPNVRFHDLILLVLQETENEEDFITQYDKSFCSTLHNPPIFLFWNTCTLPYLPSIHSIFLLKHY